MSGIFCIEIQLMNCYLDHLRSVTFGLFQLNKNVLSTYYGHKIILHLNVNKVTFMSHNKITARSYP